MRVLAVAMGSHGDVLPILAVGRAVVARGHSCGVVAHPYFVPEVHAAGLEAVPVTTDVTYESIVRQRDLFHRFRGPTVVGRMIEDAMPSVIAALRAEIARLRPDVLLVHYIVFGAAWVATVERIPSAVAVLSPAGWLSASDPVPLMLTAEGRWPAAAARLGTRVLRPLLRAVTDPWVNRVRVQNGFPRSRDNLWRMFRGGDVNLGLWSTAFRPAMPDDPPQSAICGFPWWDGGAEGRVDPELEAFLAAGEPPLVFTLGSAAVHHAGDFYRTAAIACERLGRRGVLLTGADYAPATLPAGVRAFAWAPHSWILPRGAASIHHGGIGSTAQALRAGRPQLVVALAHDQFNHGIRISRLGVGGMLPRHQLTADRLTRSLARILDDPGCARRARELGVRVAAEDGAVAAAIRLERLANMAANAVSDCATAT